MARPIPTKVSRLIPMLGSPADHEALSAARAIGRVLKREGLGFTDLAAAIPTNEGFDNIQTHRRSDFVPNRHEVRRRPSPSFDNVQDRSRRQSGSIPPFSTYAFRRCFTPKQEAEHRARVRFCQSRPWSFSQRERAFLDGIGRLHGNLTIKQGDWLAALADRLDQELRCA